MQLLCPDWVLTMGEKPETLTNTAVLIDANRIKAIGPTQEMKGQYPQAELIELPNQVLMPGLINAHTHSAMTLLRAAADDLALHDWLQNRIWPLEGQLVNEEFVYDGTAIAIGEMLLGGTTTFSDMYFYPEQTVRAALDMGARVFAGVIAIEFPTSYGEGPDDYINKGRSAISQFAGESTVNWTVAPHAPYTVSDDTFIKLKKLGAEHNLPMHCHIHETASEVSDAVSRHGVRPFERLRQLGLIDEELIVIHGVHLNDSELELMAKNGASLVHCPNSNLKLASGFAPTAQALKLGVNVALGTDGAASNNQLDLWSEAKLGSLLAKGCSGDATAWPAYQTLLSLTAWAAKALHKADSLGQIKPGYLADVISVEIGTKPSMSPVNEVISLLAYSGSASAVKHVWVNGNRVVRTQQLTAKAEEITTRCLLNCKNLWQTRVMSIG